jgi:hypothetical protein
VGKADLLDKVDLQGPQVAQAYQDLQVAQDLAVLLVLDLQVLQVALVQVVLTEQVDKTVLRVVLE